jgi:hypothetical protein
VEIVDRLFVGYPEVNEHATREAKGKANDVDGRKRTMSPRVTESNGEVVFDKIHGSKIC